MLLVTGITGHSGGHFLQELISHDFVLPLRCVVRPTSDVELLRSSGLDVDIRVGDLGDEAFLDSAMAGVDEVLHISSIFHSLAVAKAMAANGVGKGYFVHTTGVFSRFKQASQDYKEIEAQVLQLVGPDADLTFLRPTMIYGRVDDQNMIVFVGLHRQVAVPPGRRAGATWSNRSMPGTWAVPTTR